MLAKSDCHGALPSSLPEGEVPEAVDPRPTGKAPGGDRQPDPPRVPRDDADPIVDAFEALMDHQIDQRALYGSCPDRCPVCASLQDRFTEVVQRFVGRRLERRMVERRETL